MASSPMEGVIQSDAPAGGGLIRKAFTPQVVKIADTIGDYRPVRFYSPEYHRQPTTVLSLDFDDKGELLMTSESNDSLQIYNIIEGTHKKQLLSKKYGAKLAKFSHQSSAVIYASTLENDDIRYLSTHDNTFLRYFKGHTAAVTSLSLHPTSDSFLSTSLDNTLRIWDINAASAVGILEFHRPTLSAFDASAKVFAVASSDAQTVLLYDFKMFGREPFASFDILDAIVQAGISKEGECGAEYFTKLEFSNDGKSLLVGTNAGGHLVLDAFTGQLLHVLARPPSTNGIQTAPSRSAPGEVTSPSPSEPEKYESSGDCTFTPDGRFVLSACARAGVAVYELADQPEKDVWTDEQIVVRQAMKVLSSETAVGADLVAFNPRWSMFATGGRGVEFWVPERDDDGKK